MPTNPQDSGQERVFGVPIRIDGVELEPGVGLLMERPRSEVIRSADGRRVLSVEPWEHPKVVKLAWHCEVHRRNVFMTVHVQSYVFFQCAPDGSCGFDWSVAGSRLRDWADEADDALLSLDDAEPDESLACCGLLFPTHADWWAHRKQQHLDGPIALHDHMPVSPLRALE